LKYGGLWLVIFGTLILLGTGMWYIWMTRSQMWFDKDPYLTLAIVGALLLVPGLLMFLFIEE